MSLNAQQLYQMGILLNRAATDLRGLIRASGGFQMSSARLTNYARQIKQFSRRLEQTQRSIDGARSPRMHLQAKHRANSHQGALDTVEDRALKVALMLEQIMFSPAHRILGTAGRGAQAVAGGVPSKLNKRSLADVALKLEKMMSQGQSQLSASALSDLGSAHAQITAATAPGVGGDMLTPLLMTIAIGLEYIRMWGMAKGKITQYHE